MNAEIGFAERLVWFWSNHFCVSADVVNNMAGGYEREAIRPHRARPFRRHAARRSRAIRRCWSISTTLRSIGPECRLPGCVNKTGLNENLARETLELHTLGVKGVYSQDDVTRLRQGDHRLDRCARWRATRPRQRVRVQSAPARAGPADDAGQDLRRGRRGAGPRGAGRSCAHPATAAHIARKLARHFVLRRAARRLWWSG